MPHVLIPRVAQQKPPAGSVVDFGHPLAQRIAGAWLFNEGGGISSQDLVRGSRASLTGMKHAGGADGNVIQAVTNATTDLIDTGATLNDILNIERGTIVWTTRPAFAPSGVVRFQWGHETATGTPEMICMVYQDNNWYVGWNGTTDTRLSIAATQANFTQFVRQMYAFTWQTGKIAFYRNGVLLTSSTNTPTLTNPTGNFCWGGVGSSFAVNAFNIDTGSQMGLGYIYSGKALTPEEVKWLYEEPYAMFRGPEIMRRYWVFGAGAAAAAARRRYATVI